MRRGAAASPSQMGRFETRWLAANEPFALADLSVDGSPVHSRRPSRGIVLDMDFERRPHAWRTGEEHLERPLPMHLLPSVVRVQPVRRPRTVRFRPGNVHSADGWDGVLKPVVGRYRGKVSRIYFRADAGFANPEVYEFLEAEDYKYAIRLPANHILQDKISYLLKCPVERPSHHVRRYYANFRYRAASWDTSRRVIAKVEWHPGELYPRVGFIVTNMRRPAERVVAFYNKRGTCEQWIKEGKNAIKWTRLSCRAFAANAVRLQLHALAYNLANFLRTLAMPEAVAQWSLTTCGRS